MGEGQLQTSNKPVGEMCKSGRYIPQVSVHHWEVLCSALSLVLAISTQYVSTGFNHAPSESISLGPTVSLYFLPEFSTVSPGQLCKKSHLELMLVHVGSERKLCPWVFLG